MVRFSPRRTTKTKLQRNLELLSLYCFVYSSLKVRRLLSDLQFLRNKKNAKKSKTFAQLFKTDTPKKEEYFFQNKKFSIL